MRRADDARQEAEMSDARIGAHGIKSNWAVDVQVCERAAAAEGDGGAYRRARRHGQKSQASERAQQRKARKGQRVPKALLPFSFVSLFSFVLPFPLQRDAGKAPNMNTNHAA